MDMSKTRLHFTISGYHKERMCRLWRNVIRSLNCSTQGYTQHILIKICLCFSKKIKLFQSHVDEDFIEERRALLDNYLRKLVSIPDIAKSQEIANFLNNDKSEVPAQEQKRAPREHNPDDFPEDQEITDISIPSTRTMNDHVLYQIDVSNQRKRRTFSKWTVLKRFGQFHVMDEKVRLDLANRPDVLEAMPVRPSRKAKIWHDHMDDDFIEERRVLLENYLTKLLSIPEVAMNQHFSKLFWA
eukprot:TRINITY_DN14753_c0_g1_i1.p1 TRINITY_DN14753_c0_g1~~TRINITY_DN14753_c0_g1_i1.p1  ORF type:complete len:242 (+),score=21.79 TRINITY_DN14753_c0_g1_i1:140-865(+)